VGPFAYVWNFDDKEDYEYVNKIEKIFKDQGGEVFYIELKASLEERIKRNKTEHRLTHKPTKRDIEQSEKRIIESETKHRTVSEYGEIDKEHYIAIDNTNLDPLTVAKQIKEAFDL
jgi:hypothetical protein